MTREEQRAGVRRPPYTPARARLIGLLSANIRRFLDKIEPNKCYDAPQRDGTVGSYTGEFLHRRFAALLAICDAEVAGDDDAWSRAVETLKAVENGRRDCILCVRVGHLGGDLVLPRGYLVANCGECQAPVWISPENLAQVEQGRSSVLCDACSDRILEIPTEYFRQPTPE